MSLHRSAKPRSFGATCISSSGVGEEGAVRGAEPGPRGALPESERVLILDRQSRRPARAASSRKRGPLDSPAEPPQAPARALLPARKSPPWGSSSRRVSSKASERAQFLTEGISPFSPGSHLPKKMPAFNRLFPLASFVLVFWGK